MANLIFNSPLDTVALRRSASREVPNISEVVAFVRNRAAVRLVAIDGANGAGKSRLAQHVASELQVPVIHFDDLIDRNKDAYVAHIDFDRLANLIASAPSVVVEGICALKILDKINQKPDVFVYVKLVSNGLWVDEDHLDSQNDIEEHLTTIRNNIRPIARKLGESGELGLNEEVIRYHAKYRPHEKANIVFLREDS